MQSISILEGVHSALQHEYAKQQVLHEPAEVGKVGRFVSQYRKSTLSCRATGCPDFPLLEFLLFEF